MSNAGKDRRVLKASQSAIPPVYYGAFGTDEKLPVTGSSLSELVNSEPGPLTPDWNAWAEILALGAPLAGRTTFVEFSRQQPGDTLEWRHDQWQLTASQWQWADVEPDPALRLEHLTDDVVSALEGEIRAVEGPLHPMLSGGRDSRLLTAIAANQAGSPPLTAWTTSSDTGTSMEELVAARVAHQLDVEQRLIRGRHDEFSQDFTDYAHRVDFMASFHVWLMPVARALGSQRGTILDGLGGGVFLGGGFPDEPELLQGTASEQAAVDARFGRLSHYLEAGPEILAPGVTEQIEARARADFEPIARRYAAHPNGSTLTAYLTRTLPGISLAPVKVLGTSLPTVMPIMSTDVVSMSLRVTADKKRDGAWYPQLLESADPRLAGMQTAADLTKRRQHTRRGASVGAATWYRDLLLDSPVGEMLSDRMRQADVRHWADQLSRTKPQHIIRGLAMLALWLEDYGKHVTSSELPFAGGA